MFSSRTNGEENGEDQIIQAPDGSDGTEAENGSTRGTGRCE